MTKIAQRNDWKTKPMPLLSKLIAVDEIYSRSEFEQIIVGTIPEAMEDKWFIFYETPWLYLHRSWTGNCIFKVQFTEVEDIVSISEVWVNQDSEQYTETDEKRSGDLLLILLNGLAKRDNRNNMLNYIKSRDS